MRGSHEQEVVLRLRFEEKLNHLHSLNRGTHEVAQRNKFRLQAREEELEALKLSYELSQDQLSKVRAEKEILDQWKAHAEAEKVGRDQECERHRAEIDAYHEEVARSASEHAFTLKEVRGKAAELHITKEKLDKILGDIEHQREIEKKLKKKNEIQNKTISAANTKVSSLSAEIADLQYTNSKVQKKYEKADDDRKSLKAEVGAVAAEREAFKERVTDVDSELKTKTRQLEIREAELASLRAQFQDGTEKIYVFDEERRKLLEAAAHFRETIGLLDAKVVDQAAAMYVLKETAAKKEADCADLDIRLAQQIKVAHSKRLELELVLKTSSSEAAFLKKKIEQQQKTLSQTTSFLTDEEKKLQLANDHLVAERNLRQDHASKIVYLQCELDMAKDSIETLESQKNMLISKYNEG